MKITNFGKKLIALLAVLVMSLAVVSCGNKKDDKELHQENVNAVLKAIFFDETLLGEVKKDLTFIQQNGKYPDVKISWTSDQLDIVAADGKVTRPALDDARIEEGTEYVNVTVTVTATQGEATGSKSFNLKVYGEIKTDVSSIQNIKKSFYQIMQEEDLAYNAKTTDYKIGVEITGKIIQKVSDKGYLLQDNTGVIYVYGKTDVAVGKTVTVKGSVYAFYGLIEVADATCTEVADQTFTALEFEETTVSEYTKKLDDALDNNKKIIDVQAFIGFSTAPLKLYAKVEKGDKGSGDEYYLADPQTGKSVAIYHYTSDGKETELDALVGKYVYAQVYSYDTHNSLTDKYRVVWDGTTMTEAPAPSLSDKEKADSTLAGIVIASKTIEDITLPVAEGVTYALKETTAASIVDGVLKVDRPAYGQENQEVIVVATCKVGAATATKEFKVNVYAEFDPTIKEIIDFDTTKTYKLGLFQANNLEYLFSDGTVSNNFGQTVTNASLAAQFKVVQVEGGYQLQVIKGTKTSYLQLEQTYNESQNRTYTNIVIKDTAGDFVWQYNSEYNTFTHEFTADAANADAGVFYVGSYQTYSTLSASKISYAKNSFVCHLYEAEGTQVTPDPVDPNTLVSYTFNQSVDGGTYITNNPSYPNPSYYASGGIKFNFVNIGFETEKFAAQAKVTVNFEISFNRKQSNTSTDEPTFTIYGLDASGNTVVTQTIEEVIVGVNTVTLEGQGIVQVKIILTDLPVKDGFSQNVDFKGLDVLKAE